MLSETASLSRPHDSSKAVTRDAAHLSAVELAIGSVAHSLHLPLTGHLLSLNEGAFLCHGSIHSETRTEAALACYEIAGVAASLKSLAPSAKKLGPMLSIMMQGLLFSIGILIFGKKRLGQLIGFVLLSTWAFLQPLITLIVSFGFRHLTQVLHFYSARLNIEYTLAGYALLSVLLGLFTLKVTLASVIVYYLNRENESAWWRWQEKWIERSKSILISAERKLPTKTSSPWRAALRSFLNPLFLLSFCLTWIFLFIQKESWSDFIWLALRPVAIAFLIFYLLHSPQFLRLCGWLSNSVGALRPIHRRLRQVEEYWNQKPEITRNEKR